MIVYISGPMTGHPDSNRPAFFAAEEVLTWLGHRPINVARIIGTSLPGWEWADYVRLDLRHLLDAEGVAVLDGWRDSKGASLEVHVAGALGMPVAPLDRWSPDGPTVTPYLGSAAGTGLAVADRTPSSWFARRRRGRAR